MPISSFASPWMTDEHRMILETATRYFKEQWAPRDAAWRAQGSLDRAAWREAGEQGFLCASTSAEYGGRGGNFGRHSAARPPPRAARRSGGRDRCLLGRRGEFGGRRVYLKKITIRLKYHGDTER